MQYSYVPPTFVSMFLESKTNSLQAQAELSGIRIPQSLSLFGRILSVIALVVLGDLVVVVHCKLVVTVVL